MLIMANPGDHAILTIYGSASPPGPGSGSIVQIFSVVWGGRVTRPKWVGLESKVGNLNGQQ